MLTSLYSFAENRERERERKRERERERERQRERERERRGTDRGIGQRGRWGMKERGITRKNR